MPLGSVPEVGEKWSDASGFNVTPSFCAAARRPASILLGTEEVTTHRIKLADGCLSTMWVLGHVFIRAKHGHCAKADKQTREELHDSHQILVFRDEIPTYINMAMPFGHILSTKAQYLRQQPDPTSAVPRVQQ